MTQVISFNDFKKHKRQRYLRRFSGHLDRYIENYLTHYVGDDFNQISEYFFHSQWATHSQHWDYWDLRDMLAEAFDRTVIDGLCQALKDEWWYDESIFSQAEIVDRCINTYVLRCQKTAP